MWTGSITYHIKIGNNLSGQQQDLIGFSVAFGNLAIEQYLQCEKMLRIDEVGKKHVKEICTVGFQLFENNLLHVHIYSYICICICVHLETYALRCLKYLLVMELRFHGIENI